MVFSHKTQISSEGHQEAVDPWDLTAGRECTEGTSALRWGTTGGWQHGLCKHLGIRCHQGHQEPQEMRDEQGDSAEEAVMRPPGDQAALPQPPVGTWVWQHLGLRAVICSGQSLSGRLEIINNGVDESLQERHRIDLWSTYSGSNTMRKKKRDLLS